MDVTATELFAVSFSLWAGVIGLSVRLVWTRLVDLDSRIRAAETALIRLNVKCEDE